MDRTAKDNARLLYVRDGLTTALIADRLKVTERTVSRWKSDDNVRGHSWDKARAARLLGREEIEATTQEMLLTFVQMHKRTVEELTADKEIGTLERTAAMASLMDTYVKQMRAASVPMPKISELAVATDVITRLLHYVSEKHPDTAPTLLSVLEPFGTELVKVYSQ